MDKKLNDIIDGFFEGQKKYPSNTNLVKNSTADFAPSEPAGDHIIIEAGAVKEVVTALIAKNHVAENGPIVVPPTEKESTVIVDVEFTPATESEQPAIDEVKEPLATAANSSYVKPAFFVPQATTDRIMKPHNSYVPPASFLPGEPHHAGDYSVGPQGQPMVGGINLVPTKTSLLPESSLGELESALQDFGVTTGNPMSVFPDQTKFNTALFKRISDMIEEQGKKVLFRDHMDLTYAEVHDNAGNPLCSFFIDNKGSIVSHTKKWLISTPSSIPEYFESYMMFDLFDTKGLNTLKKYISGIPFTDEDQQCYTLPQIELNKYIDLTTIPSKLKNEVKIAIIEKLIAAMDNGLFVDVTTPNRFGFDFAKSVNEFRLVNNRPIHCNAPMETNYQQIEITYNNGKLALTPLNRVDITK